MAEIVNLRQARKQKSRKDKEQQAEANRHKFGQTKAEKTLQKLQTERDSRKLDEHKRDD